MDTLDDLKKQWQSLKVENEKLSAVNKDLTRQLSSGKIENLQDKLVKSYGRMRYVGILLPLLSPLLIWILNFPVWYGVVYAAFGIVMAAIFYFFVRYIREVNLVELPVAEAIMRASSIKMRQTQIRFVSITCAFIVLAMFFYFIMCQGDSKPMLTGAIVGLLAGLCIAIPKCIRQTRLARELCEMLSEPRE